VKLYGARKYPLKFFISHRMLGIVQMRLLYLLLILTICIELNFIQIKELSSCWRITESQFFEDDYSIREDCKNMKNMLEILENPQKTKKLFTWAPSKFIRLYKIKTSNPPPPNASNTNEIFCGFFFVWFGVFEQREYAGGTVKKRHINSKNIMQLYEIWKKILLKLSQIKNAWRIIIRHFTFTLHASNT